MWVCPGGSVVKTLDFHGRGWGFHPWLGGCHLTYNNKKRSEGDLPGGPVAKIPRS